MPAGLMPDNKFLIVPSFPPVSIAWKTISKLCRCSAYKICCNSLNSFSQLRDLLERFFLSHSGRLIGVNVGKADFLPRPCGDNFVFI